MKTVGISVWTPLKKRKYALNDCKMFILPIDAYTVAMGLQDPEGNIEDLKPTINFKVISIGELWGWNILCEGGD